MTENPDNVPIDSSRRWLRYAALIALLIALLGLGIATIGNLASMILIVLAWGAVAWLVLRKDALADIVVADGVDDGVHRVLVLANEGLHGPEVTEHLDGRSSDGGSEVLIVVPALATAGRRLAGAIDDEIATAEGRADDLAGELSIDGRVVTGRAGDSDPRLALEDALARFPADEVILINPPEDQMGRLEASVEARAASDVPIPVRILHIGDRASD